MLSISLPGIFENQGSGDPLRVSKVTLKWTGPVKILTKGQLGSNLIFNPMIPLRVTLDILSRYPEPWSFKILGSEIESTD